MNAHEAFHATGMGESRYDRPGLREAMEQYKDYQRPALSKVSHFHADLRQRRITSQYEKLSGSVPFDPARPTSLIYKKTKIGYDLDRCDVHHAQASERRIKLNERVPLSVAQWHCTSNYADPPKKLAGHAEVTTKFGLQGSIAAGAFEEAGGARLPVIFGWMRPRLPI